MLVSNVFRFGTDTFDKSGRHALLVSSVPLDCTGQTNVEGFTITGSQPDDTDRRIIFKIGGTLWKFSKGSLVAYTGDGEYEDVIKNGNTVDGLNALSDIPDFVGKEIYPIVALKAGWTAVSVPSIKIQLRVRNNNSVYTKTHSSITHNFVIDDPTVTPRISEIVADTTCTGNATCEVLAQLHYADGTKSAYMPLADTAGQFAVGVQFRIIHTVTVLDGTDSAICNFVTCRYNSGATLVNSTYADLYSSVQNYGNDLQTCYAVVRHDKLTDSTIEAYVNFMKAPSHRELINIGTTTGTITQYTLGVNGVKDTGIDPSSIRIFLDGQPYLEFDYNVEVSEVTVNQPKGQVITASYDYGRDSESWLKMTQDGESQIYPSDGTYMTRFTYTLSDANAVNKQISNVRLKLTRPTGTVKNQSLGKATGKTQMLVLPHSADNDSITLPNATFTYDDPSQILTYIAPKNTALSLSYSWIGEQVVIRSFASGWIARV